MTDGMAGQQPGGRGTPGATGQAGDGGGALRGWWLPPRTIREAGHDPDARFSMANERTFLAWVRTSLALLAGGVAVIQLVPSFSVPGGRHILGVALIVLSIIVAVSSYRHWALSEQAMRLGRPLPPSPLPRILGAGVSVVALAALVIVLVSIA
ncbi:MAG: YidH family protein [Gemmatimonadota bacterium]